MRAGFCAVLSSSYTAEKFASETIARDLRLLCSVFDEEMAWCEKSKRERLLKRVKPPVPKASEGYDWGRMRLPDGVAGEEVESCALVAACRTWCSTAVPPTARPTWR